MTSSSIFLRRRLFLVKFYYWPKFHFTLITGSEVIVTFVNKGLTKNTEIANTPSEFWSIYRDWVELGIPNFDTNATNEMLLNAAKYQDYSFHFF